MGSFSRRFKRTCQGVKVSMTTFLVHTHYIQVHVHCYEAVDLTNMVRVGVLTKTKALTGTHFVIKLSNEFKFPIAAFHHASEAYLVPDLLKQTYGEYTTFIDCFKLGLTIFF